MKIGTDCSLASPCSQEASELLVTSLLWFTEVRVPILVLETGYPEIYRGPSLFPSIHQSSTFQSKIWKRGRNWVVTNFLNIQLGRGHRIQWWISLLVPIT
jgi:hypothetical protein